MKNKIFKLLLRTFLVLIAMQGQSVFAQIPPTFTYDQTYGLLAADSIITTDTVKVFGDAGAGTFIQSKVVANNRTIGGTPITNAQSDLASAKSYLSGQSGTSISGTLDGQSLAAGVYTISGNAVLNDTLILTGDTNDVYIFNISGDLSINSKSLVLVTPLYGVVPGNIFWNVTGKTTLKDSCIFGGMVLSGGDIKVLNTFYGRVCLLSQSTIHISGTQFDAFPGDFYYTINSFEKIFSERITCVPSGTLTCGELILNGNFEELNGNYSPSCPLSLMTLSMLDGDDLQYCGWIAEPTGEFVPSTADAFNTCAGTGFPTNVPLNAYGTQSPHSGSGYMGLRMYGTSPGSHYEGIMREFPAGTLVSGKVYFFEMWASLAEVSNVASHLCVHFDEASGFTPFFYGYPTAISDKVNWTPIRTCFTANGLETSMWIDNDTWPVGPYTAVTSTAGYTYSSPGYPLSYYYVDDVSLKPLADAGHDQSICLSTTVGPCAAISGATYSWTLTSGPGTVNFSSTSVYNPTVTLPGATGTYTLQVTVTYGGCSDVDYVVITKLPSPTGVTATASPYTIILGNSSSLTATSTGGISYTWSPGGMTGTPVTVTPTSTTTYTVTATNSYGCTATDTAVVHVVDPKCSLGSYDYTIPSAGSTSIAIFGAVSTVTNKNILVNGDLTMNNSISFDNCNFVVAAGKKIILSNSFTEFKNYTHLYSCGDMWDGVYITDIHSQLKVNTNAMLENALNAVVSQAGGPFQINTAIFNRNRKGVDVQTYAASHPGTIKNTIFTSRYIPTYATPTSNPSVSTLNTTLHGLTFANMPSPYSGQKGVVGVTVANVANLNVGAAAAGMTNVFDGLQCGIDATSTNMTIYNNNFQNILNPTLCFGCYGFYGFGIHATGTTMGGNTIVIGGLSAYQPNNFLDIYQAISLTDYKIQTIVYNNIDNSYTGSGSIDNGNTGIFVSPAYQNEVTITEHTINNCKTGIWVSRTNATAIEAVKLDIEDNYISANSSGFCSNGINVTDLMGGGITTPTTSLIQFNTVDKAANGINILNAKKVINILTNTLTTKYASTGSLYGIKLQGCQNMVVNNNHTHYDVATGSLSGGNLNAYGIYVGSSTNTQVKCNIMQDAGRCLTFFGTCTSVNSVSQNTMMRAREGFTLLSSGIIGTQGSSTVPSGNVWDMSTGNYFTDCQTMANSSNANSSTLYVVNNTTGLVTRPTTNSFIGTATNYNWGTNLLNATGTLASCGYIPALALHGDWRDGEVDTALTNFLTQIVTDTIPAPVFSEQVNYQLDQYAFNEIYNNSVLQSDETLGGFYTDNYNASIGSLRRFEDYVASSDLSSAESINLGITPSNIVEQNQQTVNTLILKQLSDSMYTYNSEDIESLTGIADQCPVYGGNAVFQARVMLMNIAGQILDFEDNCDSEQPKFVGRTSGNSNKYLFNLYPNPNNGNMTLAYSISESDKGEVKLYSHTGQLVGSYQLNPVSKQLTIGAGHLANGLYVCRVLINNRLVKSDKVIIIK